MNESLISVRYAKALFQLAIEKEISKAVFSDLKLIHDAFESSVDLRQFMMSPVFKTSLKKSIVIDLFGLKVNPVVIGFFNLIIDNGREIFLQRIIHSYNNFYYEHSNIKQVTLISATSQTRESLKEIKEKIAAQMSSGIELKAKTDKSLLGGFKLIIDGKLIDASFSGKLKKLKKQLLS